MKIKLKDFLEKALVVNLSILIIFAPFSKRPVKVAFVIAVLIWLALKILEFRSQFYKYLIPHTPLNKPFFFFLSALIFSTVFSLDFFHSQSVFFERYLFYFLLFFIAIYAVKNEKNSFILAGACIAASLIICIGMIWDPLHVPVKWCWHTCFGRCLNLAPYLVLYTPLSCAIVLLARNKFLKISGSVSFLLALLCLIMHGSRGAWIAVLMTLLVVFFVIIRNNKEKSYRGLVLSLIFILFFAGLVLSKSSLLQYRASLIFSPGRWDRLDLWKATFRIFKDHPVLGAGIGMHEKLFNDYAPPGGFAGGVTYHLHGHNTYLEIASESGIIGFLAFIWLCSVFLINAMKSMSMRREADITAIHLAFIGSVLATLIAGLSGTCMIVGVQDAAVFWVLFGMAAGMIPVLEKI